TTEIYNMAWEQPGEDHPVWCAVGEQKTGLPTAQSVNCVTKDPSSTGPQMASLELPLHMKGMSADVASPQVPAAMNYQKFTSQDELGHFLLKNYDIHNPRHLTSCDTCHR
ncbi:MAG TPA: hypothetical protein VKR52_11225, partial [Terracidiphilus sp.]|nr:hypothetical protein [Terracidiphilus sp.]